MANDVILLANPTPADITVNSQTVKAGKVTKLTIADSTTDVYGFIAKGCVAAPAAMTNGTGNVTDVLNNATTLVEKGARLLSEMIRAINSAGSDTFAAKGL